MNSCKKEKYIGIRLSEKEYQMVKSEAEHDPDCRSKSGTINISKFIRNRVLMPERNAIRVERKMEDLIFQIRKIGIRRQDFMPVSVIFSMKKKRNIRYG